MDTLRLNSLEKRVYTRLTFDNALKTWFVGDEKDERIFCKHDLRRALDQAFDYSTGGTATKDELGNSIDIPFDEQRLNFLNKAIFNYIWLDKLTNQWIIGDKESHTPVSVDFSLRKAIDRLISK
jgi:hypothetical protein